MPILCDVIVVGAGPAGAVAARVLALKGLDVIMLDKSISSQPKVGESLPGAITPLLQATGLYPWFLKSKPLRNYGNISIWGSDSPQETDFINDPYGCGWHVDRPRFENYLREAAIDAKARFLHKPLTSVKTTAQSVEVNAGDCTITARWIIDASGKSRTVAERLGGIIHRGPPLLSLYSWYSSHHADTRSIVEAIPTGWWYSAGLPEDKRVLALQVNPKEARLYRQPADFIAHLRDSQHIKRWFADDEHHDAPVHMTDATGSHLVNVSGQRWLAIGDAALSFDPLSSQGIYNSVYTGLRGAQAVFASLNNGDQTLLTEYNERILTIYSTYKEEIRRYYRQEQRWPEESFWAIHHNNKKQFLPRET
ncbi:NAD(P)/FAD-dependent oxidoreductase (plasmid) [Yersinia sp. HM-2024]|uniref:NAD(P)/FAD-dependent oxidoreductase n=1 Tax=Yersinia sp. HM-2024 TaxID=3344550 RepID=UPI00370D02A9